MRLITNAQIFGALVPKVRHQQLFFRVAKMKKSSQTAAPIPRQNYANLEDAQVLLESQCDDLRAVQVVARNARAFLGKEPTGRRAAIVTRFDRVSKAIAAIERLVEDDAVILAVLDPDLLAEFRRQLSQAKQLEAEVLSDVSELS